MGLNKFDVLPVVNINKDINYQTKNFVFEKYAAGPTKNKKYNKVSLVVNVCLDDLGSIWQIKEREYLVKGDSIDEIKEKIIEYLYKETLDFDIIYMKINMNS